MFILSRQGGLLGRLVARRLHDMGHRIGVLGATPQEASAVAPMATPIPLDRRGEAGAAMALGRALLLIPEGPGERALDEAAIIAEAGRVGIGRVIRLSIHGADPYSDDAFLAHHGRGDEALRDSGLSHTILQSHLLMQDLLLFAPSIRAGFPLIVPDHDPHIAFIDVRDVADATVNVLQRPIHQGETQVLTGPTAWSLPDVAGAIEEATGREVPLRHVPSKEVSAALEGIGLSPARAKAVAAMLDAYEGETATRAVSRITGLPPRALEVFLMDHRQRFADTRIEQRVANDEVRRLDHALNW